MYSRNSNRRPPINLPPDYSGTSLGPSSGNLHGTPKYISKPPRFERSQSAITTENDQAIQQKSQAITRDSFKEPQIPRRMMYRKENLNFENEKSVSRDPEKTPFGNNRTDLSTDSYPPGAMQEYNTNEEQMTEPQSQNEDYSYIPPLSQAGGLGLLTGREINTDDLLLAGLIFLLFGEDSTDQNSLETALIIAILFISGI